MEPARSGLAEIPVELRRFPRLDSVTRMSTLVLISTLAVFAVWSALGLVADGAYYMWNILEKETFYLYESRFLTQAITQSPVIGAISVGVNDVPTLIRFYSAGTAAMPIMIWAAALWVLRNHRTFWLFVIAFSVVHLNSGFIAVGEYNLANACIALCAALLIANHSAIRYRVILIIASIALFASYESIAFLALPLVVLVVLRRESLGHTLSVVLLLIYTADISYATAWIIFPRDTTNITGAADIISPLTLNHSLVISLCIAIIFVLSWLYGSTALKLGATVVLVAGALTLLFPILYAAPWMHYASRSITAVALFGIISAATLGECRPRRNLEPDSMPVIAAVLLICLTVPFAYRAIGWTHWIAEFNAVTVQPGGPTELVESGIPESASNMFAWTWTNPLLSEILHSDEGQKVILSPLQKSEGELSLPARISKRFTNEHPIFYYPSESNEG